MVSYWVKTPQWLHRMSPAGVIWEMPPDEDNSVYLTFDDGPHPEITRYVLDELAKYDAKATFFCVGNNVAKHAETFKAVKAAGHAIGNHTYNHLNGWKTANTHYLKNIAQAARHINSHLFRPPYGRLKLSQYRKLLKQTPQSKVYMWSILSGDFDTCISAAQCTQNVLSHISPGAIIVFHDSEKAFPRLQTALPEVLKYCFDNGLRMKSLPM